MKIFRLVCLLSVVTATVVCTEGSASAQVAVYANFSGARLNIPLTSYIYGATLGGYVDTTRFDTIRPGLDFRGGFFFGKGFETYNYVAVGPRVAYYPHKVPISPYVEVLFGAGNVTYGLGVPTTTVSKSEYDIVGGADLRVSTHVDWRMIEYSYGSFSTPTGNFQPKSVSTGIVIRIR